MDSKYITCRSMSQRLQKVQINMYIYVVVGMAPYKCYDMI